MCCSGCSAAAALCWVQPCAVWPFCTPGARSCCPASSSWCWGLSLSAARSSCFPISSRRGCRRCKCFPPATPTASMHGSPAAQWALCWAACCFCCADVRQQISSWSCSCCAAACTFLISPPPRSGSGCVPSPAVSTPAALPLQSSALPAAPSAPPSGRQSGRSTRNTTKSRTSRWTRRTSLPGCI